MQKDLDINAVIGFSGIFLLNPGNIYDGLLLHPDNEHIIYPLGSTVVVRHILSRTQTFLRGHNHKISCKGSTIQLSRFLKMAITSPVLSIRSPDRLQRSSYGTSTQETSNIASNSTKIRSPASPFHPIHTSLPLRAAWRISTLLVILETCWLYGTSKAVKVYTEHQTSK